MAIDRRAAWVLVVGALVGGCTRTVVVHEYVRELPDGTVVRTTEEGRPIPQLERVVELSAAGGGTDLACEIPGGNVTITADATTTGVTATVRLLEVQPDDAEATLTAGKLAIHSRARLPVQIRSVAFRVPPAAVVDVSTGNGDVTLAGLRDSPRVRVRTNGGRVSIRDSAVREAIDVESGYGNVTVDDVRAGSLALRGGNGDVTAQRVTLAADGALSAHTNGGRIKVAQATGVGELVAESGYGNISVTDVGSPKQVRLKSGNGDVAVERLATTDAPTLVATTNGGKITIGTCTGLGALQLKTGYGNVAVAPQAPMRSVSVESGNGDVRVGGIDAAGDGATMTLSTNGGAIAVDACSGYQTFAVATGYGNVTITGCTEIGQATFKSGNGNVTVEGMRPVAAVTAHTNGGKVDVKGLEVDGAMDLRTGYGDLVVADTKAATTRLRTDNGALKLRRSSLGQLSLHGKNSAFEWDEVNVDGARSQR